MIRYKTIIAAVLVSTLMACGTTDKKTEAKANTQSPQMPEDEVQLTAEQVKNAGIQTGNFQLKAMHHIIKVNGLVDVPPENAFSVSVPMGGYIKSMKIIPGMMVKKGSLLATVEDQQYIQLQQDYLTAKNKLRFASADYQRQKGLNQTKASSDKVYQLAESEYNNEKVLVNALAEKLRLIGINPTALNESNITRNISIKAPVSGVVIKVNVNAGKYVSNTDVLFEMISQGGLHANLTVLEKDAANLKVGQKIVCTSSTNPEKNYIAKIHLITPSIDNDRTTSVHCDLENADRKLLPGAFLSASISVSNANMEAINDDAIVKWNSKYYVFSDLGNHKYKMTEVEPGESVDGFTAINTKAKLNKVIIKNAYAVLMKMKNSGEED
ncbi:cobalt-zinc-cadmium efflux system membrane fusion protein [Pedobacter psychrotolerans]|uniref:Cobalt-zinc-cadmium efflux system membrane fusion protein n=1 Tax=Pedobacter psychrotolerans TaxID=1843235 RepID=A0A4V2S0C5_9SPHI|nr:efflux RND transporter periplasmic adaptor subunit [Pedobacter psychrotolerans]TCO31136.1 cobalt-zinc-cadmium efflux system membrane fusion protein [Pedobacter psychrotolerans]GGE41968.1 hemolysin D [Pedobacter psychrotolerans]